MTVDFLRQRLPGRRNGKARAVLAWVDRGADSLSETLARTYFRRAGIPVQTALRYYYSDVVYHQDAMVKEVLSVLARKRLRS